MTVLIDAIVMSTYIISWYISWQYNHSQAWQLFHFIYLFTQLYKYKLVDRWCKLQRACRRETEQRSYYYKREIKIGISMSLKCSFSHSSAHRWKPDHWPCMPRKWTAHSLLQPLSSGRGGDPWRCQQWDPPSPSRDSSLNLYWWW